MYFRLNLQHHNYLAWHWDLLSDEHYTLIRLAEFQYILVCFQLNPW
jgi:hypothetical protein